MSKYYLVASYYNSRTNKYEQETIIESLKGEKLDILLEIDKFTSKYTTIEILNLIEQEKDLRGPNHLSIKYLKNKDTNPIYYRVIDNDKRFNECINMTSQSTNYILGKPQKTLYINRTNELYREELKKLLAILNTRNYELFKNIYPYNNDLSFLVKRYLNTSYDTEESKQEDHYEILVEFSRYKTFRGWYISSLKHQNNISIKKSNPTRPIPTNQSHKRKVTSIEEHIKNYEKNFETTRGITYSEFNTNKYNTDNEELLSEEEYMSMQDDDYYNKSLRRQ